MNHFQHQHPPEVCSLPTPFYTQITAAQWTLYVKRLNFEDDRDLIGLIQDGNQSV